MTIKQINMRAFTNKKLFTKACAILHPCYSVDFTYFTQSFYNIHWKVEQFPKSYT